MKLRSCHRSWPLRNAFWPVNPNAMRLSHTLYRRLPSSLSTGARLQSQRIRQHGLTSIPEVVCHQEVLVNFVEERYHGITPLLQGISNEWEAVPAVEWAVISRFSAGVYDQISLNNVAASKSIIDIHPGTWTVQHYVP
mmetsp:Transcript_46924/g.73447  ORF Transcript_46924/g.73447 Transcript_46924/m.73447 type:complete len:138 (-) Transcript_46924:859-1272(-)